MLWNIFLILKKLIKLLMLIKDGDKEEGNLLFA